LKTHRCEKSLKAEASIRYTYRSEFMRTPNDKETWRLFHYIPDFDYDTTIQYHVSEIEYCPFCGLELSEESE